MKRIAPDLDRLIFQRLKPFTPFWMEGEKKWLVMFPNEWEHEVERFDSKDRAYAFVAALKGGGA